MMVKDPVVLLVDDSKNDAFLMGIVFERAGFTQPLQHARDGNAAIAYLQGLGQYSDRIKFPMPTVVLLDLNMPRLNGFEVLDWIRQRREFTRLLVYILSASSRIEDIDRAYDLGANSYLLKPGNLDTLTTMAKSLVAWLRIQNYPSVPRMSPDLDVTAADVGRASMVVQS